MSSKLINTTLSRKYSAEMQSIYRFLVSFEDSKLPIANYIIGTKNKIYGNHHCTFPDDQQKSARRLGFHF